MVTIMKWLVAVVLAIGTVTMLLVFLPLIVAFLISWGMVEMVKAIYHDTWVKKKPDTIPAAGGKE